MSAKEIERLARVLGEREWAGYRPEAVEQNLEQSKEYVRALLADLREPSDDVATNMMIAIGNRAGGKPVSREDAKSAWRFVIDHILKEGTDER